MGEQARRLACASEDFVHRSIHEAVAWHRDMRGRYRARAMIETIYFRAADPPKPPAPKPAPVVHAPQIGVRVRRIRRPEIIAFRAEAAQLRETKFATISSLQHNRCYLCGGEFVWHSTPTMDHVVPRDPKTGGGRNAWNVLAAHRSCNNRKANRMPYACELLFLEIINEQLRVLPFGSFVRIDAVAAE